MEMPGSAPGVWKGRWQYCPMRTRRLCGLTLVVLRGRTRSPGGSPSAACRPLRAGAGRRAAASRWVECAARARKFPPTPRRDGAASTRDRRPRGAAPRTARATRAHARAARAARGDGGAPRRDAPRDAPAVAASIRRARRRRPRCATRWCRRGARGVAPRGGAELDWRRDADDVLAAPGHRRRRPAAARMAKHAARFDAAGVAPLRLVEREKGRDKRAVNFDRDRRRRALFRCTGRAGGRARARRIAGAGSPSSRRSPRPARARGERPSRWDLQVAGLRGELERWTFRVLPPGDPPPELRPQGNELSASGDRAPALLHVLRAPERPYDLRIEAWLSPSLHHLPAGLRMSTPPGPWSLSLWQRDS